jgi:hypothetical protein
VGDPVGRVGGQPHVVWEVAIAQHHRELAAEYGAVELEGLQRIAGKVEIRIDGLDHVDLHEGACARRCTLQRRTMPPRIDMASPRCRMCGP